MRTLPSGLAAKLCRLLRLETPIAPDVLAGVLIMLAGKQMKEWEARLPKINEGNQDFKDWLSQNSRKQIWIELFFELLCALSWLALDILSHDDFAAEPGLFGEYALKTFLELESLLDLEGAVTMLRQFGLEGEAAVTLFRQVEEETKQLYLFDRPSLRGLIAIKGVPGWFTELIDRAEREQNYLWIYACKAGIRIVAKLPVEPHSIWYQENYHLVDFTVVAAAEFFNTFRPVLVAPWIYRG
jgi:hypothetical protein